jgi:tRNA G18 (ribose-2'-O)-methylase SpoU
MSEFVQQRHKSLVELTRPREIVVACEPLRSNVNLSRILRAAGCCGVTRLICAGPVKVIDKIARDGADAVEVENHRTLPPALRKLRAEGYPLIGLEQTTGSRVIWEFPFPRKMVLVVGNERGGLSEETLQLMDQVVEIPGYGLPFAHNAATATAIALYEYCRQYPTG